MTDKELENKILRNVRMNIAMSEFGRAYTKKKYKTHLYSLKKAMVILLTIGLITIGFVQAKNFIKEFEDRKPTYVIESIADAINNGYVENLNMEYAYSDGIGLKINSFSMSNNNINFILDFKLENCKDLEEKNIEYGYILYNENNEVYHIKTGTNKNLIKDFLNEKNIKSDNFKPNFLNVQSSYIAKKQDNIVINESMSTYGYLPKTKKLFFKIIGIGYREYNGKYKAISNSNWLIELDIPEKFYEATNIEYILKEDVQGINLEKVFVSDTSMTFVAIIEGINGNNSISIIDENGKEYLATTISYIGDRIKTEFPIYKEKATNKLYIKTIINNEEKITELVKK